MQMWTRKEKSTEFKFGDFGGRFKWHLGSERVNPRTYVYIGPWVNPRAGYLSAMEAIRVGGGVTRGVGCLPLAVVTQH